MRIITKLAIVKFYGERPESRVALEDWYSKTKKAEWTCFADVRRTFKTADNVGNQHYVFNIKGNDFRLIAVIKFTIQTVYVRFIGTHSEYDGINAKTI